jgi:hypothetical protein
MVLQAAQVSQGIRQNHRLTNTAPYLIFPPLTGQGSDIVEAI